MVFEGEKGRKYAGVIARIVESVQAGLEEVSSGNGAGGEDSSETVSFILILYFMVNVDWDDN